MRGETFINIKVYYLYMNITTIRMSKELRNKLKDLGKKGETYEHIIWNLLKHYKKEKE